MTFTKFDHSVVDSSIWDECSDVLKVFEAFWTKCDKDGIVNATYNAMYRASNLIGKNKLPLPMNDFDEALNILLAPDLNSRTKDYEGRRIVRLEESKWLVVTYKNHREYTYSDNPDAIRKREYRNGTSRDMSQCVSGHSISVSDSVSDLKEDHKRKTFEKPTVDQVKQYCAERKNSINAEAFIDFYSSKGWLVGKTPMKDWKAAVRTWERNNYGSQQQAQQQSKTTDSGRYRTI